MHSTSTLFGTGIVGQDLWDSHAVPPIAAERDFTLRYASACPAYHTKTKEDKAWVTAARERFLSRVLPSIQKGIQRRHGIEVPCGPC